MVTTPIPPRAERISPGSLRLHGARPARRPLLAIGSLVLVVASAAGFASIYAGAGGRVAVLAVARRVPVGGTIQARDLVTVRVTPSRGVDTVGAGALHHVVGRPAADPLVPDTLLSPTEIGSGPGIDPGDAVVGVATKSGQLPAEGVLPGDIVAVLYTPQPGQTIAALGSSASGTPLAGGGASVTGTVLAPRATVRDVGSQTTANTSDGVTVVSVIVPSTQAPAVATASAAGQAALVLVGPVR